MVTAPEDLGSNVKRETLITLLGAGYAGTDFVEGFMRKYLPGGGAPGGQTAAPAQPGAGDPAVG